MQLKRSWLWMAGILFFILVVFRLFLQLWVNPLVEELLTEAVAIGSNSRYQLKEVDAEVYPLRRRAYLRNIVLEADTLVGETSLTVDANHTFYLKVPELRLSRISFPQLIFQRKLKVRQLIFEKAQIDWFHFGEPPVNEKAAMETFSLDLFPLIKNRLSSIEIDRFSLDGASLLYQNLKLPSNHFLARDFSLEIDSLQLDSTTFQRINRPVESSNLKLKVDLRNYSWSLPDSSYQLKAKAFSYASSIKDLSIEGLEMEPNMKFHLAQKELLQKPPPVFYIKVPELSMKGLEGGKAIFERMIQLDSLSLQEAELFILRGGTEARKQIAGIPDLFPLINTQFDSVKIKHIGLENAQFEVYESIEDTISELSVEQLNGTATGFHINKDAFKNFSGLPYVEELNVNFSNYHSYIRQKEYKLTGSKAKFSTTAKRFSFEGFRIEPLKYSSPGIFRLNIPQIELTGLDLGPVLDSGYWNMSTIQINSPNIALFDYPKQKSQYFSGLPQNVVPEIIDRFFNGFEVDHFAVEGGKFELKTNPRAGGTRFGTDKMNISINRFKLNEITRRSLLQPFEATNIELGFEISDYAFTLPDSSYHVTVKSFGISSRDSVIWADSVHFSPTNFSSEDTLLYDIFLPSLSLSGIDINKAYFNRKVSLDSLLIQSPVIDRMDFYPLPKKPIPDPEEIRLNRILGTPLTAISIDHIQVLDAIFKRSHLRSSDTSIQQYELKKISLNNFHMDTAWVFNPRKLLFSDEVNIEIDSLPFGLPDYHGSLASIKVSSVHGAEINDILLQTRHPDKELIIQELKIPYLELGEWNPYEIWKLGEARLGKLIISEPDLDINIPWSSLLGDSKAFASIIEGNTLISLAEIKELEVIDGNIEIKDQNGLQDPLLAKDLNIGILDFSWNPQNSGRALSAKDVNLLLDIQDYEWIMPDSTHKLRFKDIGVSTARSWIYADSLRIIPLIDQTGDRLYADIKVDRLQLDGIDLLEVYEHKTLDLEGVTFWKPDITLGIPSKVSDSIDVEDKGFTFGSLIKRDPYPTLSKSLHKIKVERVSLGDATLNIHLPSDTIRMDDISVRAYDFVLDSSSYQSIEEGYLFTKALELVIRDYTIPLPQNSFYHLESGSIYMSTVDDRILINDLSLYPKYDRGEFAARKQLIADQFSIDVPELRAYGIDWKSLIQKQEYQLAGIEIYQPSMKIFKDKRYPESFDKRPLFPVSALNSLDVVIRLDSIIWRDGNLFYEEKVPEIDTLASFRMGDLSGSFYNISTLEDYQLRWQEINGDISGNIFGQAPFSIQSRLSYTSMNDAHYLSGSIGAIEANRLNKLVSPVGAIRINDGSIHKATFSLNGNSINSRGNMEFLYNDLNISLLNKKGKSNRGIEAWLGSAIANTFVIRTDNPRRKRLRPGKIRFQREPQKGVVIFWVKSILEGIKSSIGLKSKGK